MAGANLHQAVTQPLTSPRTQPLRAPVTVPLPARSRWPVYLLLGMLPLVAVTLWLGPAPASRGAQPLLSLAREGPLPVARFQGLVPVQAARLRGRVLEIDLASADFVALPAGRQQAVGEFFLFQLGDAAVRDVTVRAGEHAFSFRLRKANEFME